MGSTTPLHSLRYPAGGDAPNVPSDMSNLATDVDNNLPLTSTTEPTKVAGLVWYNPTTGQTQVTDGSTWYLVAGNSIPWTAVTATAGWTSALRARVTASGLCILSGTITKASGNISNTTATQIATLPTGCAPLGNVQRGLFGYVGSVGTFAQAYVQVSAGSLTVMMTWNQQGSFSTMYFDGTTWPVS